jgi:PPOX class probable F420-dependent enzyme
VDLETALEVIRSQHRGVLATMRADGTPALTPITANVDDDARVIISSRQTAYKVRNLRRNPLAYLCVFPDTFFGGSWVQIDGTAEIIDLPEAMEHLVDYYRRTAGEHPDWDDYRAAMARDQRVLIRLTITRVGPNVSG